MQMPCIIEFGSSSMVQCIITAPQYRYGEVTFLVWLNIRETIIINFDSEVVHKAGWRKCLRSSYGVQFSASSSWSGEGRGKRMGCHHHCCHSESAASVWVCMCVSVWGGGRISTVAETYKLYRYWLKWYIVTTPGSQGWECCCLLLFF